KGNSFTQFFPGSLIWFGLASMIVLLWLPFFLADRSLVRRPHMAVLRRIVGLGMFRLPLVVGARLLLRLGCPPALLQSVAEYERDLCCTRIAAGAGGVTRRLVVLTRLLMDLAMLRADDRAAPLRAACYWQDAILLMRFRSAREAAGLAPYVVPACARALRLAGLSPHDALAAPAPDLD